MDGRNSLPGGSREQAKYLPPDRPGLTFVPSLFKRSVYLLKTILVLAPFSSVCAPVKRPRESESLAQAATDLCDKNPYLPMFAKGMLQARIILCNS